VASTDASASLRARDRAARLRTIIDIARL